MERKSRHQTTWHLINIKSRRDQSTEHYIQIFQKLQKEDPMISLPRGKCGSLKSVTFSELLDERNMVKWIKIILLSYTIVDPNAFYNKRNQMDVDMDNWDSDIVANKKEVELYFIPSVHTLAVRRNSDISLANIVLYLSEALNRLEPDTFDVDVLVERDILDRILNAHAVYSIEANISFSNPGHTKGFEAVFDNKLRNMDPNRINITAKGSREHPLINEEDGMLQAIVNLSEHNGNIKATIQPRANSKVEKIDSNEHPRILVIPQIVNDVCSTIYNTLLRRNNQ
ncbi:MAG: DUF4747 family protein [Macellibacteroides fermentans]|uniref:DUF4747 family protein n=1 Tax=Macellibacteroides fermentans TaxID=879969 RepID=UPI003AC225A3